MVGYGVKRGEDGKPSYQSEVKDGERNNKLGRGKRVKDGEE